MLTLLNPCAANAQSEAEDISIVNVQGWSSAGSATSVNIYNLEGRKIGVRDYSAIDIRGAHRWAASFDLVEIAPGEWIQKRLLETAMCDQAFAQSKVRMPTPGKGQRSRAVAMGSGTACPE